MAEPYPLSLRTILRASKARQQPAAFRIAEPRRGYGYAQAVGTDTPVFWDVEFLFTQSEAIRFQLWFTQVIGRGVTEFILPIRTEFGLIPHTCRFLPDGLLDCTEDGTSFRYRAQIMARAQIIPDGYVDASDLIVAFPNLEELAESLDLAIAELPT